MGIKKNAGFLIAVNSFNLQVHGCKGMVTSVEDLKQTVFKDEKANIVIIEDEFKSPETVIVKPISLFRQTNVLPVVLPSGIEIFGDFVIINRNEEGEFFPLSTMDAMNTICELFECFKSLAISQIFASGLNDLISEP